MARIGLRERNKKIRAEQVLDAAEILFRERGYEATHIETIAEQALVAPTTVYNYFATKPNLLMALALRHVRVSLPERRGIIKNLPEDPIEGVIAFESLLAAQAMRHLSRECWRVILSGAFLEPGGPASRTGARLNQLIMRHYVQMVVTYQARGKIRPEVEPGLLSNVIVSLTTHYFGEFVATPSTTMDDLMARIRRSMVLVLTGSLVTEKA